MNEVGTPSRRASAVPPGGSPAAPAGPEDDPTGPIFLGAAPGQAIPQQRGSTPNGSVPPAGPFPAGQHYQGPFAGYPYGATPAPPKPPSTGRGIAIGIGSVLVVAVLIAAAVFFGYQTRPDAPAAAPLPAPVPAPAAPPGNPFGTPGGPAVPDGGSDSGGTRSAPERSSDPDAEGQMTEYAASDLGVLAPSDGAWLPQLSAKQEGLEADGQVYDNAAILDDHLALRASYPDVRLVWSGDWTSFRYSDYWVTVVNIPFASAAAANAWCDAQGLPGDDCYAKRLSTTDGESGSSVPR